MNDSSGGVRVEMKVSFQRKQHGRKVLAVRKDGQSHTHALRGPREAPREARLLALAYRWQRLIDEGKIENQAEIARRMGLTRARVSQIMAKTWLNPGVSTELCKQPLMI